MGRCFFLLGLGFFALALLAASGWTASAETRHVVVLYDERPELPGLAALDAEFAASLASESSDRFEIYRETMDLSRFPGKDHESFLREMLRRKYSGKKIDVVVAVFGPPLRFLLSHGEDIFPRVPIVFCGLSPREIVGRDLPAHVRGVVLRREFAPTLDAALRIHPDTRQAIVVSGSSEFDLRILDQVKAEFQPYENRVQFSYTAGQSVPQILDALHRLPPRSIVLFTTLFNDGTGEGFVPHDLVPVVSRQASAPLYAFVDQYLGRGIVGGSLYSIARQGSEAAAQVKDVLAGRTSEPRFKETTQTKLIFDWREMQRWGIAESQLPGDSEVRFRNLTLWDRYWKELLLVISAVLLQAALISWLLYEHRRRRIAEALSLQRVNELARMNRFATAGALSASLAHEIRQPLTAIMAHGSAGLGYLQRKVPNLAELRSILADIVNETHRADDIVARVRAIFRREPPVRREVDLNLLVREALAISAESIRSSDIEIDLKLTHPAPLVLGDPVQLQQAVLNLITNGTEAMLQSRGARVLGLRTRVEADQAILCISDTGPNIDPALTRQMFEPLFTTKSSGMGMGLPLSKTIIEAHDGRLEAKSNDLGGMEFQISLPILKKAGMAKLKAEELPLSS